MLLLLSIDVGGFKIGDMIFTLLFFLILIGIVIAIIVLIVKYKKRGSRLQRVEEKLDVLLADKEKKD